MAVATFDTLKFANTLKAAGVPDKQAEAQATAFSEVISGNFKELATKDDLDRVAKAAKDDLDRVAKAAKDDLDRVAKSLRDEIERTAKDAKSDLDQAVKAMKQEIKDESHKLVVLYTRQAGDIVLLKWMTGAVLTALVGVLVRLFVYPIR